MRLINTKGMALIGPGWNGFWAALQVTVVLIMFIAINRQLRVARSASAVGQIAKYRAQVDGERMRRHGLHLRRLSAMESRSPSRLERQ